MIAATAALARDEQEASTDARSAPPRSCIRSEAAVCTCAPAHRPERASQAPVSRRSLFGDAERPLQVGFVRGFGPRVRKQGGLPDGAGTRSMVFVERGSSRAA